MFQHSEESEESFWEETSVEDSLEQSRDASGVFDITGVSTLNSSSIKEEEDTKLTSVSDEDGPLPMDDSVEVFLAKKLNKSQVVNVSSSSSGVLELSKGKTSDSSMMDL